MLTTKNTISHTIEYSLDELQEIFKSNFSDRYSNAINGQPVYKITDNTLLPGETFREYPKNENICYANFKEYLSGENKIDDLIEVSNLGRIRINNNIKVQYHTDYGYLKINVNNYYYCVYRMVAETWCKCPVEKTSSEWHVHHINNNGFDNRPGNLIWVSSAEHRYIEKDKKVFEDIRKEIKDYLENNVENNFQINNVKDFIEDYYLLSGKQLDDLLRKYLSKYKYSRNDFPNLLLNSEWDFS
ncbi:MAG TPA: hypothetical protein DDW88_06265 [Treponema sp.]|nr:hypothetical protein [Treponema sp.]